MTEHLRLPPKPLIDWPPLFDIATPNRLVQYFIVPLIRRSHGRCNTMMRPWGI
jgi:hypothetical protein